jgi:hypothetical protein
MATFTVSDVALSRERLPSTTLVRSLHLRTKSDFEAGAANLPDLVAPTGAFHHPFIEAVGAAFADHYPLVLSPDDVWLCLAQGLAIHVNEHAETLRGHFVQHEGKTEIEVIRDGFVKGSPDNDWPGCFAEFSDRIAAYAGKKRDLVVADFSTTGPIERAASEIVLMSALQAYFSYVVVTRCGIPEITLLGNTEDWRSIRRRAEAFAELDLGWWTAVLLPVLDHFIAASSGHVDKAVWQSFYKLDNGSGGPLVTGWINALFPYINDFEEHGDGATLRGVKRNGFARIRTIGDRAPYGWGHRTSEFPQGFSVAPFLWKYLGTEIPMELLGGFTGVSQSPETLAVRPAIGWAVRAATPAVESTR